MDKDRITWKTVIITTIIMFIGMIVMWNPIKPNFIFGFVITFIGFTPNALIPLGLMNDPLKNEK